MLRLLGRLFGIPLTPQDREHTYRNLVGDLTGPAADGAAAVLADVDRLESAIVDGALDDLLRQAVGERLRVLMEKLGSTAIEEESWA